MRHLILALMLLPAAGFAASGQDASSAAIRILDKQTNRIQRFVVDVNTPAPNVPFTLSVARCVKNVAGVPGQDAAWLDITPKSGGDKWFSGWMFNTYPDVATLDNPRYDVQVMGCDISAEEKAPTLLPEIKIDAAPVVTDDEAPAAAQPAQEGAASSAEPATPGQPDPYYVPGLEGGNTAQTTVTTPASAQPVEPEPIVDNSVPDEPLPATETQDELHRMMEGQ